MRLESRPDQGTRTLILLPAASTDAPRGRQLKGHAAQ